MLHVIAMSGDSPYKLPKSPKRVAIEVGLAVLVLGAVLGYAILAATGRTADRPFERGEALGRGLVPLALLGAAIGYVVQSRRLRARK